MKWWIIGLLLTCEIVCSGIGGAAPENNPIEFTQQTLCSEKKKISPCGTRTLFLPRSQGTNWARRSVGYHEHVPPCDLSSWGYLYVALEYQHSMKSDRIAQYLFGSTQLHFSGSQVADRNSSDLLADYFGLGTTFKGSVAFNPSIESVVVEANYYGGLDTWSPGLFWIVNFPLVITRWDLGLHCNEVNNLMAQDAPVFPPAYMAQGSAPTAASIREALAGEFVFGDMKQPLTYGEFRCGAQQKVGIAQIDFGAGYTFFADESSHISALMIVTVPTGTVPQGIQIFEPTVGNGRLWEVGPALTSHYDLYCSGDKHISFQLNGVCSYQFKRFQVRSFDFLGKGSMSRYMLLKEFNESNEYAGSLINGIDFTTRSVRVGGSVKADLVALLSYYSSCFGIDIGYNLYARSKEKLRLQNDLFPAEFNSRSFGIKGTEGVFYKTLDKTTGVSEILPTSTLTSVQNRATIAQGAAVTNPQLIQTGNVSVAPITWDSPETGTLLLAQSSNPPVILTADSLDILSGSLPHQLTNKFFIHISYMFDSGCWEHQFGLGGEVELDGRARIMSALNQWGIWGKWAVTF